eukprot:8705207-Pyramimonas_sp.AAC.1
MAVSGRPSGLTQYRKKALHTSAAEAEGRRTQTWKFDPWSIKLRTGLVSPRALIYRRSAATNLLNR